MKQERLGLEATVRPPKIVRDYLQQAAGLEPFYAYAPTMEGMGQALEQRKAFDPAIRQTLVSELNRQYKGLPVQDAVTQNIEALSGSGTFTVTTGHQLNLLTGPLFFFYKVVQTIQLARKVQEAHKNYRVVPVFWMASEDHDFAEIDHTYLFGQKVAWEHPAGGKGPVGRLDTQGLDEVLAEVEVLAGDRPGAGELMSLLREAYLGKQNWAVATRALVHRLFGHTGLLVLDADTPALKAHFRPVMEADMLEQVSGKEVEATDEALKKLNYKEQAHPRKLNFFYLEDNRRTRFLYEGDQFKVEQGRERFDKKALRALLAQHPEHFSPNVLMRPLYQESILPNIAYTGGAAEVAYWLQLKSTFDHYRIPMPVVLLRNSVLWMDGVSTKRMRKTGVGPADLFQTTDDLIKTYLKGVMEEEEPLAEERKGINKLWLDIARKAAAADPSLKGYVAARQAKADKLLENVEHRIIKAVKARKETEINQLSKLKEKLFPNRSLQERVDNFVPLYLQHDADWWEPLLDSFDPFDPGMYVFMEN